MEAEDATKPVENPCLSEGQGDLDEYQSGSDMTNLFTFDVPEPPPDDLNGELITLCSEAEELAHQYEMALRKKIGTQLADYWRNVHVRGFSFLQNKTDDTDAVANSTDTPKNGLEQDVMHVQISLVYLRQILKDDEEKSNCEFQGEISKLYKKVTGLLCHFKNMGDFENHVTDDVMPNTERNIDSIVERLKRDYIFARDLGEILKSKKKYYNSDKTKPCS